HQESTMPSAPRGLHRLVTGARRVFGSHTRVARLSALAAFVVGLVAISGGRPAPAAAGYHGAWLRDVKVISGSPSGLSCGGNTFEWIKDGTDLNKGAGGKYIYLCYKYQDGGSPIVGATISRMYAVRSSSRYILCPNGDTLLDGVNNNGVDGNLNAGSRGAY